MPALDATLREKIDEMKLRHRLRVMSTSARMAGARVRRDGRELVSFCCNDYLGLSQHPEVIAAAQQATAVYGTGAGASRLITGNTPLYGALETMLAEYKHTEAACVFGSGYMANIGTIPALVGRDDLILADKLVHASILDGIRLSGARLVRFAHNDAADCDRLLAKHRDDYRQCLVITETVFSMDGDVAPLRELRAVCDHYDAWLMTDDAHGFGQQQAAIADIQLGTLSKALGAYGGYVCGSRALVDYLATSARSFIFTTGLPPAVLAAAYKSLEILQSQPQLAHKALAHARRFAAALGLPEAQSAIVPLVLGSDTLTLDIAARLEKAGYLVGAIRPPTVPEGSARLRFTFSSSHEEDDVSNLISEVNNACIGA
jgi:8-amino-7-oxononanoate synthase